MTEGNDIPFRVKWHKYDIKKKKQKNRKTPVRPVVGKIYVVSGKQSSRLEKFSFRIFNQK